MAISNIDDKWTREGVEAWLTDKTGATVPKPPTIPTPTPTPTPAPAPAPATGRGGKWTREGVEAWLGNKTETTLPKRPINDPLSMLNQGQAITPQDFRARGRLPSVAEGTGKVVSEAFGPLTYGISRVRHSPLGDWANRPGGFVERYKDAPWLDPKSSNLSANIGSKILSLALEQPQQSPEYIRRFGTLDDADENFFQGLTGSAFNRYVQAEEDLPFSNQLAGSIWDPTIVLGPRSVTGAGRLGAKAIQPAVRGIQRGVREAQEAVPLLRGVEKALAAPGKPTPARTGVPITVPSLRGSGRAEYGSVFANQEAPTNILGTGRYSSPSRTFAETYGPNIEELSVTLQNPLVLRNNVEYAQILDQAGLPATFEGKRLTSGGLDMAENKQRIDQFRAYLDQQGYDGVIVDPDFTVETNRLMDDFSGQTIVEFNPPVSPAAPTAPRSVSAISPENEIRAEIAALERQLVDIDRRISRPISDEFPGMPGGDSPFSEFMIPEGEATAAAERLSSAVPAIEQRIKRLQDELSGGRVGRVFSQEEFEAGELAERFGEPPFPEQPGAMQSSFGIGERSPQSELFPESGTYATSDLLIDPEALLAKANLARRIEAGERLLPESAIPEQFTVPDEPSDIATLFDELEEGNIELITQRDLEIPDTIPTEQGKRVSELEYELIDLNAQIDSLTSKESGIIRPYQFFGGKARQSWAAGHTNQELVELAADEGLNPRVADWFADIDPKQIEAFKNNAFKRPGAPTQASLAILKRQLSQELEAARITEPTSDIPAILDPWVNIPDAPVPQTALPEPGAVVPGVPVESAGAARKAPISLFEKIAREDAIQGAVPETATGGGIRPPPEGPPAPAPPGDSGAGQVYNHISMDSPGEPFSNKFLKGRNIFMREMVDDIFAIGLFEKIAKKAGAIIPVERSPYIAGRMIRGMTAKAKVMIEEGTVGKQYWKMEGGRPVPDFRGPGLEQILEPVKEPVVWRDFATYLTSKRSLELSGRKIETGIPEVQASRAIQELETKYPNFPEVAEGIYRYQDDLLTYGEEMGLLSPELVEKLRNQKAYVPFQRLMDEAETTSGLGRRMANILSPIRRIRGSERPVINPLESIVKNTYQMVSAAERNQVGVLMADLAQEVPELQAIFKKIPTPTTRVARVTHKELGISIEDMDAADIDAVYDIFRPSVISPDNVVTVLRKGEKEFYEVDPELYRALLNLDRKELGMVGKFVSYPARWTRAGAVLSPDFIVRNPLRDQLSTMIYSNYGFVPGVDALKGLSQIFRKTDDYTLYKLSGAEHSMLVSMDRDYLQKSFKQIVDEKGFTDYVKPLAALQKLSETSEKMTRMGEFSRGLGKGVSPTEAGYSARDLMDFNKMGTSARALNQIIPFFNASIRGMDKMISSFRSNPIRTSLKTFMGITVPSILLYSINRDNPRYQEIPQWQKDIFWIIILPGDDSEIIRIPKPFEPGILFGSVPERLLEEFDNKDRTSMTETFGQVLETGTPGYMPQILLPIIENQTNHNFFLERPIVPRGKQTYPPELQYGVNTSETSKKLGEIVNYSPAKIDNLVQGWSAGLGRYAFQISDILLEGTGIVDPPPGSGSMLERMTEMPLSDVPVVKSFVVRDPYGTGSASVNLFYKRLERYTEQEKYLQQMHNPQNPQVEKYESYKRKHPDALPFWDFSGPEPKLYSSSARHFRRVAHMLSKIRTDQQAIYNAKDLSPKDKRERIMKSNKAMSKLANIALQKYPLNTRGPQTGQSGIEDRSPSRPIPTPIPDKEGKWTSEQVEQWLIEKQRVPATP